MFSAIILLSFFSIKISFLDNYLTSPVVCHALQTHYFTRHKDFNKLTTLRMLRKKKNK